jgi:RNA polymerase sigma-70 factor (ECF subfamily)
MVVGANDHEVIEACQRGDHDAFRTLFDAHKDKVYSIALRFSGDPATAMDVAQETFVKLMSSIRQFRGEASFDSWLYRLVVNCCMDHQRRRRRLIPLVDDLLSVFSTRRESVLHELLRTEEEKQVQEVVGRLSPEHKMVVVLRYTEGLSYESIAEVLGCSRGTVASRLNRAHKVLERRLSHLRKVSQK